MLFDQRAYSWRGSYTAPGIAPVTAPGSEPGATSVSTPASGRASLKGLRLVVKDLFHIAGLPTGAGNPDWLASHPTPSETSPIVASLMAAGAKLVGKTLTDELAYSLNGQNIHYGTPHNPRSPDRLAGGSSTGSAVAVAAGEADIGLGTDTGGSIRVPASYNGLFGLRPSHGLLSTEHMVPLAPLFDTVGWMANDAKTLERVGEVLLPPDLPSWTKGAPIRVAIMQPELAGVLLWSEEHEIWFKRQRDFELAHRQPISGDWLTAASECFRVLQGRAIWRTHSEWITRHKPVFAPDIQQRLDWCRQLSKEQECQAIIARGSFVRDIEHWLQGVDALLLPTTPGPAPLSSADTDWMAAYRSQLMGLTAPAGLAGLPQLHLPVLNLDGAPAGISLMGRPRHDRMLLQMAVQLVPSLKVVQ